MPCVWRFSWRGSYVYVAEIILDLSETVLSLCVILYGWQYLHFFCLFFFVLNLKCGEGIPINCAFALPAFCIVCIRELWTTPFSSGTECIRLCRRTGNVVSEKSSLPIVYPAIVIEIGCVCFDLGSSTNLLWKRSNLCTFSDHERCVESLVT